MCVLGSVDSISPAWVELYNGSCICVQNAERRQAEALAKQQQRRIRPRGPMMVSACNCDLNMAAVELA